MNSIYFERHVTDIAGIAYAPLNIMTTVRGLQNKIRS